MGCRRREIAPTTCIVTSPVYCIPYTQHPTPHTLVVDRIANRKNLEIKQRFFNTGGLFPTTD
jgi:hypothetical protein